MQTNNQINVTKIIQFVSGPPGAGKTTFIKKKIEADASFVGVDECFVDKMSLTVSLTKYYDAVKRFENDLFDNADISTLVQFQIQCIAMKLLLLKTMKETSNLSNFLVERHFFDDAMIMSYFEKKFVNKNATRVYWQFFGECMHELLKMYKISSDHVTFNYCRDNIIKRGRDYETNMLSYFDKLNTFCENKLPAIDFVITPPIFDNVSSLKLDLVKHILPMISSSNYNEMFKITSDILSMIKDLSNHYDIKFIEATIAGGKSTFVKNAETKGHVAVYEPVDIWQSIFNNDGDNILRLFYVAQQNNDYDFMCYFQLVCQFSRLASLLATMVEKCDFNKKQELYVDRSPFADYYFFKCSDLDKSNCSHFFYGLYYYIKEFFCKEIDFDLTFLPQISDQELTRRIQKQRPRDEESGTDMTYFFKIRDMYIIFEQDFCK